MTKQSAEQSKSARPSELDQLVETRRQSITRQIEFHEREIERLAEELENEQALRLVAEGVQREGRRLEEINKAPPKITTS